MKYETQPGEVETPQSHSMGWATWLILCVLYVSIAFNIIAAPYIGAQHTPQHSALQRP